MRNKVILARPHDFIVDEMRACMKRNGFEPVPLKALKEIALARAEEVAGVVISTAASSIIPESFAVVFQRAREQLPEAPIAVATLSRTHDAAVRSVQGELGKVLNQYTLITPSSEASALSGLGRPTSLLLLKLEDLSDPKLRPAADSAITAHFKR